MPVAQGAEPVPCDDLGGGLGWGPSGQSKTGETCMLLAESWFTLLYGRDQHNTVKQLSSN